MKVLRYENRKVDATLYDICTPEKESAAYLLLFKELNEEWHVYSDLAETEAALCEPCTDGQHKYCRGNDSDCECAATPGCATANRSKLAASRITESQRALYKKALTGDVVSIRRLMVARRNYEYESVWELNVIDPLEMEKGEDADLDS